MDVSILWWQHAALGALSCTWTTWKFCSLEEEFSVAKAALELPMSICLFVSLFHSKFTKDPHTWLHLWMLEQILIMLWCILAPDRNVKLYWSSSFLLNSIMTVIGKRIIAYSEFTILLVIGYENQNFDHNANIRTF